MPIKGLSDRGLAFPEIGQIRKGSKKRKNDRGKEIFGLDLNYFRVEFGDQEQSAADTFRKVYGDKPAEIRIVFPFNEVERMWDPWLEAYTAGRLVARSDGEFIVYQLDDKGEVIVHNWQDKNGNKVPHPANNIAGYDYEGKPVFFKHTGRLKVIVSELARAAYLTVMTNSKHDIGAISDQLAAFKTLNNGQLAGIPFLLRRKPKEISTPNGDGPRVRRVKWLISIEADPKWVKAKLVNLNTLALPQVDESMLLPAGPDDTDAVVTEYDEGELDETPAPEQQEPDISPMTYEEAADVIVPTTNGKEKIMSMLSVDQLNRVYLHAPEPRQKEAAKIVLKHDFDMEPATE